MLTRARRLLARPLGELDALLRRDRRNVGALLLKGNVLEIYSSALREMHDKARECQEAALAISPNSGSALTDMGDWYAVDGQYRRALKFYDSAIRQLHKGPNDGPNADELEAAYIGKASALRDWSRMAAARKVAREGLRYCPRSVILRAWSKPPGVKKVVGARARRRSGRWS
jgi:tetratricopeptide (TPR) repeat protein